MIDPRSKLWTSSDHNLASKYRDGMFRQVIQAIKSDDNQHGISGYFEQRLIGRDREEDGNS